MVEKLAEPIDNRESEPQAGAAIRLPAAELVELAEYVPLLVLRNAGFVVRTAVNGLGGC